MLLITLTSMSLIAIFKTNLGVVEGNDMAREHVTDLGQSAALHTWKVGLLASRQPLGHRQDTFNQL